MHIVYLIENIDTIGGIQGGLVVRVNALVKNYNHKITIVCTNHLSKVPAYKIHKSVELIFLDKLSSKNTIIARFFLQWKQSLLIINNLNPDIVVSVKYTLHNFFFKMIRSKAKFVSEMRETKENYDSNISNSFKSKIYQKIRNYVLRTQDLLIVLTKADKINWGFSNIEIIHNARTIESIESSKLLQKQVLAIGRLTKVKGYDKLLDVWRLVIDQRPDWNLKICGAGEEYDNLMTKITKLKLEKNVSITNKFLPVIPEFLNSSILLLTSQFESFGNVLVEAKVCGVPVIAFDAPNGPREIIDDGKDGFLIPNNDNEAMALKTIYLIDHEKIRREMGKAAKINAEKYNVDIIVGKYNESLTNILKNNVKSKNINLPKRFTPNP